MTATLAPPPRGVVRPDPPEREPRRRSTGRDWAATGLVLVLVWCGIAAVGGLLQPGDWQTRVGIVPTLVLLVGAVVRTVLPISVVALLAQLVTVAVGLTLLESTGAIAGLIPTPDTVRAWGALVVEGQVAIASQGVPAVATVGITFILAAAVGLIAIVLDLLAGPLRSPALTALPTLGLFAVPVVVAPRTFSAIPLAVAALAFVALVAMERPRRLRGPALAAGALAVLAGFVAPFVLPGVSGIPNTQLGGAGRALGVDPTIDLGADLRRPEAADAFRYATSADSPPYFRLAVIDQLEGSGWGPSTLGDYFDLPAAPQLPGEVGDDVETVAVATQVEMSELRTEWLPVPYLATSIEGLDGRQFSLDSRTVYDPGGDPIDTYTVESLELRPTADQLRGATSDSPPDEAFTVVPEGLPDIVTQTAATVGGSGGSPYERALALQDHFLSDVYRYSVETPVEEGFDGTGMDAVAQFLEARTGYCVHYASAMAVMARVLDIPSRLVVGFLPGRPSGDGYLVTTDDLHAWPELWFDGIGWVRFEPTPGRGSTPAWAQAPQDPQGTGPSAAPSLQPEDDPTALPSASALPDEPTPTPTSSGLAFVPDGPTPGERAADVARDLAPPLAVLLLLAAPAIVRGARRGIRRARVRRGRALPVLAWRELVDTATDGGVRPPGNPTVRQTAAALSTVLEPGDRAAITALAEAVERSAYARDPREQGPMTAERLDAALDSLRSTWSVPQRVRATLLPSSLWTGSGARAREPRASRPARDAP